MSLAHAASLTLWLPVSTAATTNWWRNQIMSASSGHTWLHLKMFVQLQHQLRYFSIAPLFHTTGLIASVSTSLQCLNSIVSGCDFDAADFQLWQLDNSQFFYIMCAFAVETSANVCEPSAVQMKCWCLGHCETIVKRYMHNLQWTNIWWLCDNWWLCDSNSFGHIVAVPGYDQHNVDQDF